MNHYKSIIFDFDGVIVDSNSIKEDIFLKVGVEDFSLKEEKVLSIMNNKSLNRYEIINYFCKYCESRNVPVIEDILEKVSYRISEAILKSNRCQELSKYKEKTKNASWFIISAGDKNEILVFLEKYSLTHLFDGGIFGNELTKDYHIENLLNSGEIKHPVLSIGDSNSDYLISQQFSFTFLGVTNWSSCLKLKKKCLNKHIESCNLLDAFILELC